METRGCPLHWRGPVVPEPGGSRSTPGGGSSPLEKTGWMKFVAVSLIASLLGAASCHQPNANNSAEAAVREVLEHYFATWTAKDMDAYGACFHPSARITFVGPAGRVQTDGLTDFLHGQRLSHAQAATPMTEVPTEMKIISGERVTQAWVRWKLTKGSETVTGTDCFTLIKTDSGWKIASLVFYND